MSLDNSDVVDAVGVEDISGHVVLTVLDSWDWQNETRHLLALQSKLNTYFNFVESGQLLEEYPDAVGRSVVIDVVGRFPIPPIAVEFLSRASDACADLGIQVRSHYWPGSR
jgi:hypothetical protein